MLLLFHKHGKNKAQYNIKHKLNKAQPAGLQSNETDTGEQRTGAKQDMTTEEERSEIKIFLSREGI